MMTSDRVYTEAFVWIWLPGMYEPVVAGKLLLSGEQLLFHYGRSYLARHNAIPIYKPELPLVSGLLPLPAGLHMPGSIRDASPDAWGRRVLINKKLGLKGAHADTAALNELTYLLESGSDRIGALDFQLSATEYVPRNQPNVSLVELLKSAERVERGVVLTQELDQALYHGSSIGGARPKALIEDNGKKFIAKFSTSTDLYSVVKAEFVAMHLAQLAGMQVAPVSLSKASGKDVLLIERFDRVYMDGNWQRLAVVSALTLFGLDEMMARYASYIDLAEIVRHRFTNAAKTLKELFARLVFNVLCGNTDDHARNHAAFWDGNMLKLTPAYDICPQGRAGNEASQAMLIGADSRFSRLSLCLDVADHFLLSRKEAIAIMEKQLNIIIDNWNKVCGIAEMNDTDRTLLWGRQFLNPFAYEDLRGESGKLKSLADKGLKELT
jgi:serine/threonine-protein kinase HipA